MVKKNSIKKLNSQKISILVAEDNEVNSFLLKRILTSHGYKVDFAENGMIAVSMVKNFKYDLVLMDIQMPEMDGIQAAKAIRALPDSTRSLVPILAVTANTEPGDKEAYTRAGINGCIAKPINESILFKNINMALNNVPHRLPTSQLEAPANEKLYDLSLVRSLSGGDEAFVLKMIDLFIKTMPDSLQLLQESVKNEQWDDAGKAAHKMKSTIDAIGISSLKNNIRQIENYSKQRQSLDEIYGLVKIAEEVLFRCIESMKKDFNLN